MKSNPQQIAVLVGWHADLVSGRPVRDRGDAVALALALRVAGPEGVRVLGVGAMPDEAARDYLVQAGIAESRIQTISYGKERPFDPGHDEAAWAKNRRAHSPCSACTAPRTTST